ncbi:MAG: DUF6431 domain-containing protein [Bacillota bacterium]|nr:DUF6431 domain-containing protein [Bacillota bacterium]
MTGEAESRCPICGGKLKYRDRRKRFVRDPEGHRVVYLLRRLRCQETSCRKLHTELPDVLIPYKRYKRETFEAVTDYQKPDVPTDDRTHRKMRAWFRYFRDCFDEIHTSILARLRLPPRLFYTLCDMVTLLVTGGHWPPAPVRAFCPDRPTGTVAQNP